MPEHLKHSWGDATRLSITSEMKSVKCMTQIFKTWDWDQSEPTGPQSKEHTQADQGQDEPVGGIYPKSNVLNQEERDGEVGKEGVSTHEAHTPPFPKRPKNPSPMDLPTRKKHNAVPP